MTDAAEGDGWVRGEGQVEEVIIMRAGGKQVDRMRMRRGQV